MGQCAVVSVVTSYHLALRVDYDRAVRLEHLRADERSERIVHIERAF